MELSRWGTCWDLRRTIYIFSWHLSTKYACEWKSCIWEHSDLATLAYLWWAGLELDEYPHDRSFRPSMWAGAPGGVIQSSLLGCSCACVRKRVWPALFMLGKGVLLQALFKFYSVQTVLGQQFSLSLDIWKIWCLIRVRGKRITSSQIGQGTSGWVCMV